MVNLLTSALFFHSLHIVLLCLLLISPLVVLLLPLVLNCKQIYQMYYSAPLLWNSLPSDLYVTLLITSLLHLGLYIKLTFL